MPRTEVVDSISLRHVLEGLKLEELESLNNSGYLPDKFNAWKSCAATWSKVWYISSATKVVSVVERRWFTKDLTAMHIAGMRERNTAGGGALDAITAFRLLLFNFQRLLLLLEGQWQNYILSCLLVVVIAIGRGSRMYGIGFLKTQLSSQVQLEARWHNGSNSPKA